MASWLRAAEELFEVVDRTAKQVVRDRVTEELGVPSSAVDYGMVQRKSSRAALEENLLEKPPLSSIIHLKATVQANESRDVVMPTTLRSSNSFSKEGAYDLLDKEESKTIVGADTENHTVTSFLENAKDVDAPKSNTLSLEANGHDNGVSQTLECINSKNVSLQRGLEEVEVREFRENCSKSLRLPELDGATQNRAIRQNQETDIDTCLTQMEAPQQSVGQFMGQATEDKFVLCKLSAETDAVSVDLFTDKKIPVEPVSNTSTPVDSLDKSTNTIVVSHKKPAQGLDELMVEDHILEVPSLLQGADSSSKSKEARLAKVCTRLSSRLQEYKAESAQLEELLDNERKLKDSSIIKINQLQQELATERAATNGIQFEMTGALSSKNNEIERLSASLEKYKQQYELATEEIVSLQADIEVLSKSRDTTEARMMQALREELASAERRAEEERVAHSETRTAAVERETQLENHVAEAISALLRTQGVVDEKVQKIMDLEHKVSALEVECATLNQQLQEKEVRAWREQKRQSDEILQNAWREESERAREVQRDMEAKIVTLEADCQKLRVELTSLKRDSDQSSRKANAELEKRLNELSELLYLKQTQLEAMASEKAAALLQLEKELKLSKEKKRNDEADKNRLKVQGLGYEHDNDLKSFESFSLQQRKIVSPSIQRAVKFLDSGVVSAGRFLWRRPLARVSLLLYLVFVHLFLMYLLQRLQEQVDRSISFKEDMDAAVAAGLLRHGH